MAQQRSQLSDFLNEGRFIESALYFIHRQATTKAGQTIGTGSHKGLGRSDNWESELGRAPQSDALPGRFRLPNDG